MYSPWRCRTAHIHFNGASASDSVRVVTSCVGGGTRTPIPYRDQPLKLSGSNDTSVAPAEILKRECASGEDGLFRLPYRRVPAAPDVPLCTRICWAGMRMFGVGSWPQSWYRRMTPDSQVQVVLSQPLVEARFCRSDASCGHFRRNSVSTGARIWGCTAWP
jgi:hypothetical protein